MHYAYYEPNKRSMLIASILLHILLLFLLLYLTREHLPNPFSPIEKAISQEKQEPHIRQDIAALKPRKSMFGAPVIFEEEPQFTPNPLDESAMQAHPVEEQMPDEAQEQSKPQEEIATEQKTIPQEEIPTKPLEEQKPQPSIEPSPMPKPEKTPTPEPKEVKPEPEPEPKPEPKIEKKPQTEQQAQQKKQPVVKRQPAQRLATRKNPGNNQQDAGPIQRQVTFADLMNGFVASMKDEGNDWLEREGNPNIRPDFEELKRLSYVQKIAWYLQNEWRRNTVNTQVPMGQAAELWIIMYIAKNGNLQSVKVVQSSGYEELDKFLVKGIKNAGPFPKVPNHFETDLLELPFRIYHVEERTPIKSRAFGGYR